MTKNTIRWEYDHCTSRACKGTVRTDDIISVPLSVKDLFPRNIFKWKNSWAGRVFAVSSTHTISPSGRDPRRQPGYTGLASRSVTTLLTDAGEVGVSHVSCAPGEVVSCIAAAVTITAKIAFRLRIHFLNKYGFGTRELDTRTRAGREHSSIAIRQRFQKL